MFVDVPVMAGVPMPVMDVVAVIRVGHALVTAIRAVGVTVSVVSGVHRGALVPVTLMRMVQMATVEEVGVVIMTDAGMTARSVVLMGVWLVGRVGESHDSPS